MKVNLYILGVLLCGFVLGTYASHAGYGEYSEPIDGFRWGMTILVTITMVGLAFIQSDKKK